MGFTEILLIIAIALVLFGPEDLPDIARKIGKVVFEVRKVTHELTKEFQSTFDTPSNLLNKAFEQTTTPRVTKRDYAPLESEEQGAIKIDKDLELLTYEDEIMETKESPKVKADDPLAELPSNMVSYEEKGASR